VLLHHTLVLQEQPSEQLHMELVVVVEEEHKHMVVVEEVEVEVVEGHRHKVVVVEERMSTSLTYDLLILLMYMPRRRPRG